MRCFRCQRNDNDDHTTEYNPSYITRLFLNPSYTLRKQMLLCYGTASIVSAIFVYSLGCIALHYSFYTIKCYAEKSLGQQRVNQTRHNNRNVADLFSVFVTNQDQGLRLIRDLVTERIVGYPDPGWETDEYVPFPDIDRFATQRNKYPLQSKPLPLEWEIIRNVNESNKVEHLQERADYMPNSSLRTISTASASYFMAGMCNPNVKNSTVRNNNCTIAHNNVSTGGVLRPTKTNRGLYEKSADIGVLLKPIYESTREILQIAVYFHNSGASTAVKYPGTTGSYVHVDRDHYVPVDRDHSTSTATSNNTDKYSYTSVGCDWMTYVE
jgi:hypothetical protein